MVLHILNSNEVIAQEQVTDDINTLNGLVLLLWAYSLNHNEYHILCHFINKTNYRNT